MSKKLIAIPEGNLLRIAETKSITTLSALKEKTSVDRKTLRAINAGQPVKETTLQSIADGLRVPLAHLHGSTIPDNASAVAPDGFREIKLEQLDATALRRIAGETNELNWFLKIDQVSEELETLLLKLRNSLQGWFAHEYGITSDPEAKDNLAEQIDYIKTSVDIDETVEALTRRKLKIFGATYVVWRKAFERNPDDDYYPVSGILEYTSHLVAALSIVPEQKPSPTVRIHPGWEPPPQIVESELSDSVVSVWIDHKKIWSRSTKVEFGDDGIPT